MSKAIRGLLITLIVIVLLYFIVPLLKMQTLEINAAPRTDVNQVSGTTQISMTSGVPGARDGGRALELQVTVEAAQRTIHFAQAGGEVDLVAFREGQAVKKGDQILNLVLKDVNFNLERAKAAKAEAERALRQAEHTRKYTMERADQAKVDVQRTLESTKDALEKAIAAETYGLDRLEQQKVSSKNAVTQSELRLEKALRTYNQHRTLAGVAAVERAPEGRSSIAERPPASAFDSRVVREDDYIIAELGLAEAEVALQNAEASWGQFQANTSEQVLSLKLGVKGAKERLEAAEDAVTRAAIAWDESNESTQLSLERAQHDLELRKLALSEAEYALSKHIVVAEHDGVLTELNVQRGDRISLGHKLVTIVNPNELMARVFVPAEFLPLFQRVERLSGKPPLISVTTDAFSMLDEAKDLVYDGEFSEISNVVNPSTLAFFARVRLQSLPKMSEGVEAPAEFALRQGMLVRLHVDLSSAFASASTASSQGS